MPTQSTQVTRGRERAQAQLRQSLIDKAAGTLIPRLMTVIRAEVAALMALPGAEADERWAQWLAGEVRVAVPEPNRTEE